LGSPRRVLIVVHDLVVTALAMLATLYVRFADGQNGGLEERYPWLAIILPCYVAYAGLIYWYFHLYMAKWRFASLPDVRNIFQAVTVLAVSLLVLDYILLYPTLFGTFFFGKVTIALYWFLQMFFWADLGSPTAYSGFLEPSSMLKGRMQCRHSLSAGPRTQRCCYARSRAAQ